MYSAIFLTDKATFERVSTQSVVIDAHEPFNMVVIDSANKLTVDTRKVKKTIEFSDFTLIPTNRVIVNWGAADESKYRELTEYCKTNKIVIVYDHYNKGLLTIEIPRAYSNYEDFADKLDADLTIEWVEEDITYRIEKSAAYTYDQHWHLGNIQASCAWMAMAPWAVPTTGVGAAVDVSIIDGGIDINHPDLIGKISSSSWNVLNDNSNVSADGIYDNHATAVAGIIAASNSNNNYVLSLTNDRIKVRVIKAFYSVSSVFVTYQSTSQLLEAIDRAGSGAHAVCMSFGGPAYSDAIQLAITNEIERSNSCKGVAFFAAAGNNNLTSLPYPAAYDGVVAIAASTNTNTKAPWSNYGSGIYMAAPGVSIRTTDRTGTSGYSTSSSANPTTNADVYNTELATTLMTGTSASAAIAAAVAGCIKSVNNQLTYQQVINIMKNTAFQGGGYNYSAGGKSQELGYGIVRLCDAVNEAIDLISDPEEYTMDLSITNSPATPIAGTSVSVTCVAEGTGPIWGDISNIKLEYYASPFPYYLTSSATLMGYSWFYNIVNGANTLTSNVTIPNSGTISSTNYLVVKAIARDYCGNELGGLINNGNDYFFYEASAPMTVQMPQASPNLAVQVLSFTISSTGVRIYKVKYTNVGTVTITSINRTYGWVGGSSQTNTLNLLGTTSTTTPMLPGQSRTLYLSYPFAPPQYPATYFHQINTVNGAPDGNPSDNYSSITVNQ